MRKLLFLLLCLFANPAWAVIALDGTPQSANSTIQTLTLPAFTTTGTSDTVIIDEVDLSPTANSTISGISGCSLTWAMRTSFRWGAAGLFDAEEWYATTTSPLTSCVVTITLNSSATYQDRAWIYAYSGTNTTTPFDTNVSLPADSNFVDTTKNIAATISTTATNTVLTGFMCASGGYGTITYPSGFVNILSAGTSCNPSGNIVSSAQSSVTETWSWTGSSTARALIVDALQAASGTPTPKGPLMDGGF